MSKSFFGENEMSIIKPKSVTNLLALLIATFFYLFYFISELVARNKQTLHNKIKHST